MPKDFMHALHDVGSDSFDSSIDSDHSDSDGNNADLEELQEWCRIMRELPPDASAPQLCSALGATQLAYSNLHIEMKKLQTNYNSLLSTLPQNCKRVVENNPNTVLDNNIAISAKKYCFLYHFWVPKDLFPLTTLPPGYDLNDLAHWNTPESKLAGLKAELCLMLPNDLGLHSTTYHDFGRMFSNAIGAERPNILKPIKDNAQQLFAYLGLGADLFTSENSRALRRSNETVKVLLKMHPGNVDACYTPLSPLLFPKPDTPVARDLFKTQLLARYLLSSDHELTTIGEENGFKYQDDFKPQQSPSPPRTPSPDLRLNPDSASTVSIPHHMPAANNSVTSVTSALSVDVANLSLRGTHTSALPLVPTRGRELAAVGRCPSSRMAEVPAQPQLAASVSAQEPLAKEHRTMRSRKGKGKLSKNLTRTAHYALINTPSGVKQHTSAPSDMDLLCCGFLNKFGIFLNSTRAMGVEQCTLPASPAAAKKSGCSRAMGFHLL
ncbi:hypothetical protein EDC04DRAFT_2971131 [Pisolithus marmoratus]|nr:hypothetical protein EDC04DRAFT_2971131 [Pisolithus marmoratus]